MTSLYRPDAWERAEPGYAEKLLTEPERPNYVHILDSVAASYQPGMRMLEVGCAGGHNYARLCKRKEINDFTGVDVTESYIKVAKKHFPKARWICEDARKLPFKDQEFDITISFLMLLHLDKDGARDALKEMCRVTKSQVFLLTYVASKRYDSMVLNNKAHHPFLYNIMGKDELIVPGWETRELPSPVEVPENLSWVSEDIKAQFILRRV